MSTIIKILAGLILSYVALVGLTYFFQRNMIYFPQKLSSSHQFSLVEQLPHAKEIFLTTSDGKKINCLFFHSHPSQPVILYFHGNGGCLAQWQYIWEDLAPLKVNLFIIDYRGYGKSEGTPSETGIYKDAKTAYQFLLNQGFRHSDIILYGRSLGTGPALQIAENNTVKGIILEAPFISLTTLAHEHYPILPTSLMLKDRYDNISRAPQINTPVMTLHGGQDQIVPPFHSQHLAEAFSHNIRRHIFPQQGHNDLNQSSRYLPLLQSYLQHLSEKK